MNPLVPVLCLATGAALASTFAPAPEPGAQEGMKEMMEKAARWTQPGENHAFLQRFLGRWDIEIRFFMGGQPTPPEKGTSEGRWLIDGRWLQLDWNGSMLGMKAQGTSLIGYDNFKMSFVSTSVTSGDTAMVHAEGDLTQDKQSLLMYGTLDEYLTGEHDKMVKYAWRFVSADEMRLEVHDLPIGETGTKVLEISYKRAK